MEAFEGKTLKVYLNTTAGSVVLTGRYIDMEDDFLVIENSLTKKIQYYSKYYIKYIEIVKDVEAQDDEYDQ